MPKNEEGALYKYLCVAGIIRYGYCDDRELKRYEPTPINPDFVKNPVFTDSGYPLIRKRRENGKEECTDCNDF